MLAYLDNSSTTKQSDQVTEAMYRTAKEAFGNPSSLHRLGVQTEKLLKSARKTCASLINADPDEVYFTSCGTESDNTALFGAVGALKRQGNKIITTAVEHSAILESCKILEQQGFEVVYLPVDRNGHISLADLERELNDDTILVSVMHVNNESGAVMPIAEIGKMVKAQGKALFHCDAVQSYGKLPIDVRAAQIDMLSASAHKIHGPKGMGLFYLKKGVHIPNFMHGGGQERGFRPGTENVPGIVGFATAAEAMGNDIWNNMKKVREMGTHLRERILTEIEDTAFNGPSDDETWLPNIVNISFNGCRGEVLLHMLEQADVYVSTGSACSTHKKGFSHVLMAMGLKDSEAEGAVRFSLSSANDMAEIDYAVDELKKAVVQHRKMMNIARRMGR